MYCTLIVQQGTIGAPYLILPLHTKTDLGIARLVNVTLQLQAHTEIYHCLSS